MRSTEQRVRDNYVRSAITIRFIPKRSRLQEHFTVAVGTEGLFGGGRGRVYISTPIFFTSVLVLAIKFTRTVHRCTDMLRLRIPI